MKKLILRVLMSVFLLTVTEACVLLEKQRIDTEVFFIDGTSDIDRTGGDRNGRKGLRVLQSSRA